MRLAETGGTTRLNCDFCPVESPGPVARLVESLGLKGLARRRVLEANTPCRLTDRTVASLAGVVQVVAREMEVVGNLPESEATARFIAILWFLESCTFSPILAKLGSSCSGHCGRRLPEPRVLERGARKVMVQLIAHREGHSVELRAVSDTEIEFSWGKRRRSASASPRPALGISLEWLKSQKAIALGVLMLLESYLVKCADPRERPCRLDSIPNLLFEGEVRLFGEFYNLLEEGVRKNGVPQ